MAVQHMSDDSAGEDEALSALESFERWREEIAGIFDVRPLDPDFRDGFHGDVNRYNLGSALLGRVATSAQRYTRSEGLIGAVGVDHLLVQLYESGNTTLEIDGSEVHVRANDVVVIDLSRPLRSHASAMRATNLVIPRTVLDLDANALDNVHGAVLSGDSALGRFAGDHLRGLIAAAPDLPPHASEKLVEASAAILSAGLSRGLLRDREGRTAQTASLLMLRRFVENNLADPDLGPALLMRRFGLSRSALYRMFAPLDGVSEYVRNRRLDRANLLLNATTGARGGVGSLARQLGFSSEDAFSRAFRSRFGLSPRDAARARLAELVEADGGRGSLTAWLRRLAV